MTVLQIIGWIIGLAIFIRVLSWLLSLDPKKERYREKAKRDLYCLKKREELAGRNQVACSCGWSGSQGSAHNFYCPKCYTQKKPRDWFDPITGSGTAIEWARDYLKKINKI